MRRAAAALVVALAGAAATATPAHAAADDDAAPARAGDDGGARAAAGDDPSGRVPARSYRNELLLLPRLMLTPPRVALHAVAGVVRGALVLNERYRLYQRVIDALTSADGLVGVRPTVDFALDYRALFGLSFFDERVLGARTGLYARAATGGPDLILASVLLRPIADGAPATLELEAAYLARDDQVFRAIPSLSTPAEDTGNSRYALSAFDLWLRPRLQLGRLTALGFVAQLGSRRYGDGRAGGDAPISEKYCRRALGRCLPGTVDERLVPGFYEGSDFARGGVTLHADSFDRPSRPTAGARLDAGAFYTHSLTDAASWAGLHASVAVALDLWQGTHVVVVRLGSALILPVGDAVVPFSELATLGGVDSMRGFRAGRFRDFSTVMVSAEYRWPIWMWADALLFVDYGGAAGREYRDFDWARLRPDIGAGIRIVTAQHVMARVQLGYGFPDGLQLNFILGGAP